MYFPSIEIKSKPPTKDCFPKELIISFVSSLLKMFELIIILSAPFLISFSTVLKLLIFPPYNIGEVNSLEIDFKIYIFGSLLLW